MKGVVIKHLGSLGHLKLIKIIIPDIEVSLPAVRDSVPLCADNFEIVEAASGSGKRVDAKGTCLKFRTSKALGLL